MAEPVLIDDLIAEILLALEGKTIEREMEADWEDVTDVIHLCSVRAIMLRDLMEDYSVAWRKDGNRIKAYKPDLLRHFGTTDFSVRRRSLHVK